MKVFASLIGSLVFALNAGALYAQTAAAVAPSAPASASEVQDSIPADTAITTQNWQTYKSFMPDGMVALFEGQYYWKMPGDVKLEIGPTIIHPLPTNYVAATEKYASQVSIEELPSGGLNLRNYKGGAPFPNPAEPHKGWKILADVWYRYIPHLIVDPHGTTCSQNSMGSINCGADEFVGRQLSFNTDPGIPSTTPGAEDKFYTEWFMTLEPENERYNASVVISYTDLTREQDIYAFIPSLRRAQRVASSARCSQYSGTDFTSDEYRYGFNANLTQMKVEFVAAKRILALVDAQFPTGAYPADYDMPLGWPKPSWGKWQVRDVDVISASKIPSAANGYCYGKRVMYVDKATSATLWLDLYDMQMKYWKFGGFFLKTLDVPGVGPVTSSGAAVEAMWDMQNKHSSSFSDPGLSSPFYVNELAPKEYNDVTRYSTANGLNEIMQ
ncbi:MAG: DUF1329 domain-containing protein [Candidatus Binataceae bacterium]|jgi:hypothetical protein